MDVGGLLSKKKQIDESMNFGNEKKLVISGVHQVRIVGEFASAFEHFVEVAPGTSRPVYCGGPSSECALCKRNAADELTGDKARQDLASKRTAKEKFYFNVISRNPSDIEWHKSNKHSMILAQNAKGNNVGPMVLREIASICQMRKDLGQDPNPETFDIILMKEGSNLTTKYKAQFSGTVTPLTEEEKQYQLYDLAIVAQHSDAPWVAKVMRAIDGGGWSDQDTSFPFGANAPVAPPPNSTLAGPLGGPPAQQAQQTPPWQQPVQAPAQPPPPTQQVAPPPIAPPPPPPQVPPQANLDQYIDTKPNSSFDPNLHYKLPCQCKSEMQIARSGTDMRDLRCHGCGKIYGNPWKKK